MRPTPTQTLFAPEHLKNLGQLCFDKNRELFKNSFWAYTENTS